VNRCIAALASALLLAIACGRETHAPEAAANTPAVIDDSKPIDGGTLIRRGETDVATLNPVLATSTYDRRVVMYLFTPLVHLDINLRPISGIAQTWEISEDGKRYTFHLNPKATFDDGTPVLASDVLFTINKIVDPNMEATQVAGGFDQLDSANTKVIDPHTIVVAFKVALAPQIIQFNSLFPVPEHVYSKGDFRTDFTSTAVGSGPYKLVRRVPGKEVVLERREDFWGTKPHIKTVLFKTVTDLNTAWNAVKRGDIDETIISSDVWTMESQRADLQRTLEFRRFYTLNYNFIGWNIKDPLFADKRVRRAMAQCIDLKSIINNLYHGTARAMSGPFTPDEWAYNPNVPVIEFDPQAARRTLTSLGWFDTDNDGILDRNKKPFTFDLLITAGPTGTAFGQLFQAAAQDAGVKVNVVALDPTAFFQRTFAGNFQAAYLSWDLDPDPDPFTLFHSSQVPPHGQNFVAYSNPVADKLMEEGRRTFDIAKRIPIYQKLHEVLGEDQPYTCTVQVSSKWAINKRVRNVKESKAWGLFLWYPGELDWWIAPDARHPAVTKGQ
jgi:peptide/nickel transport system substrate-binding protein